jgi:hypothetical protein
MVGEAAQDRHHDADACNGHSDQHRRQRVPQGPPSPPQGHPQARHTGPRPRRLKQPVSQPPGHRQTARLGRDAPHCDDRDDPAHRGAGHDFSHGMHHSRDRRALHHQCGFYASILDVAAALRQFLIGRLERLHALTNGRARNNSTTIVRISANC